MWPPINYSDILYPCHEIRIVVIRQTVKVSPDEKKGHTEREPWLPCVYLQMQKPSSWVGDSYKEILAKGEKYIEQLWQINVSNKTNPCDVQIKTKNKKTWPSPCLLLLLNDHQWWLISHWFHRRLIPTVCLHCATDHQGLEVVTTLPRSCYLGDGYNYLKISSGSPIILPGFLVHLTGFHLLSPQVWQYVVSNLITAK